MYVRSNSKRDRRSKQSVTFLEFLRKKYLTDSASRPLSSKDFYVCTCKWTVTKPSSAARFSMLKVTDISSQWFPIGWVLMKINYFWVCFSWNNGFNLGGTSASTNAIFEVCIIPKDWNEIITKWWAENVPKWERSFLQAKPSVGWGWTFD